MKPKLSTSHAASERANSGPYVHDTEADEWEMRGKEGEAMIRSDLAHAASFEAFALLELLARRRGKR